MRHARGLRETRMFCCGCVAFDCLTLCPALHLLPVDLLNIASRFGVLWQAALAASVRRKAKRSSANSNAAVVEGKLALEREPPVAATILSPKVVSVLRSSAKAKASRQHAVGKGDCQKEAKEESKHDTPSKPTKTVSLTLAALSRKRSEGRSAPALQRWLQKTLSPASQQHRPRSSHSKKRSTKHGNDNGGSKHTEEDSPAGDVSPPRQERKRKKKKKKDKGHRRGSGSDQPDAEAKGAESTSKSRAALPSLRHARGSTLPRPTSAVHSSLPKINIRTGTAPASFGGGALPSIYSHQSPRGMRNEESKSSRQQRLPSLKL